MPEYLSPGVYIEERNTGPRPIEGVGTAMAAFVGFAPAGPPNKPQLITNWSQYVRTFGKLMREPRPGEPEDQVPRDPHMPGTYLSHAVRGFFLNGGGRCYVTRMYTSDGSNGKSEPAQIPSRSSRAVPALTFSAKDAPSSDIQIEIAAPTATGDEKPPEGAFTVKVRMGDVVEEFVNVTSGAGKDSPKPVTQTINQESKLVAVQEARSTGTITDRLPELGNYLIKTPQPTELPAARSDTFIGDVNERSGLAGLEIAEDATMVCCPDLMAAYEAKMLDADAVKRVQLAMIAHCEGMGDRVAILDPLPNLSPQEMKKWREESNYDSRFAAMYYPWIKVDSGNGKSLTVPPSGHIAGIYARNDTERGVHKAPANEVITGASDAANPITKGEQDVLNPMGVNCLRSFTGRGLRVWGARTLSSDPAWRYVNVRRLFNYVEKSIERGTQWIVFEPNNPDLWARVQRDVNAFLLGVWRDGMLFGTTPQEAFYVKCDAELNPQDVRDRGQLIVEIGISPVKPAEFVVFRFSQWAGGGA